MRQPRSAAIRTTLVAAAFVSLTACSSSDSLVPQGDRDAWTRPPNPSAELISGDRFETLEPGHLFIDSIGVNANVVALPTVMRPAPFLGGELVPSFGVPPDMAQVAWWSDGPKVGGRDMAVLLGHSQVNGWGVFNNLGELKKGDEVSVETADGRRSVRFKVVDVVVGLSKSDPDALQRSLTTHSATSQLALVTCGGEFDDSVLQSDENIVVYAVRL